MQAGRLLLLECNKCAGPVATLRGCSPPSTRHPRLQVSLAFLCPDSILQLQASISPEALSVITITALTPPVQSWLLQPKQSLTEYIRPSQVSPFELTTHWFHQCMLLFLYNVCIKILYNVCIKN